MGINKKKKNYTRDAKNLHGLTIFAYVHRPDFN